MYGNMNDTSTRQARTVRWREAQKVLTSPNLACLHTNPRLAHLYDGKDSGNQAEDWGDNSDSKRPVDIFFHVGTKNDEADQHEKHWNQKMLQINMNFVLI